MRTILIFIGLKIVEIIGIILGIYLLGCLFYYIGNVTIFLVEYFQLLLEDYLNTTFDHILYGIVFIISLFIVVAIVSGIVEGIKVNLRWAKKLGGKDVQKKEYDNISS